MKNLILLPLLLLSLSAYTQVTISLRGGPLFTVVNDHSIETTQTDGKKDTKNLKTDAKITFARELSINLPFNQYTGFSTGLGYTEVGVTETGDIKWPNNIAANEYVNHYTYKYLTIPLLFTCRTNPQQKGMLGAEAGFTFNFNTSARFEAQEFKSGGAVSSISGESKGANNIIPGFLLGIKGGAKFTEHLSFEAGFRYNISLAETRSISMTNTTKLKEKYSSAALLIGLSYTF